MAEYHGDLMYKVGNLYKRADDRNYAVAILLALLFGVTGAHRFYLNDSLAYVYFVPCVITALIAMVTFMFGPLLWYCALASIAVLGEIVYFIVCWARR